MNIIEANVLRYEVSDNDLAIRSERKLCKLHSNPPLFALDAELSTDFLRALRPIISLLFSVIILLCM